MMASKYRQQRHARQNSTDLLSIHTEKLLTSRAHVFWSPTLPLRYWNYAVQLVPDCRQFVSFNAEKKSSHEIIFAEPSSEHRRIRPFGWQVAYRPLDQRRKTFSTRARYGICRFHGGGRSYDVLTMDKNVKTKYVRPLEHSFPGMYMFYTGTVSVDDTDYMESTVEQGIANDDTSGPHS